MAILISGALLNGAGIPMSGCRIILKSRVTTSEVVMRTIADVVTGNSGEYSFEAQIGKYCVYLKQDWRDEYCVGDIAVYDDSKPGSLNDFLTALDEGDLKPDVVKRFEEMVAQAQQSAESAAESERQAGQHAADAQKIKEDCQTLADNVQQNADSVAKDKKQVALLASSATQDAARAEQAVKDADKIVDKAVDKLDEAATLTGEAKASAEAAAKSEQNAKSHADNAAGNAQQTVQDVAATETARDDAERYAEKARQDATATAEDRKATAKDVKSTGANAAAAGQSAQDAAGYARAAEQAKTDIDITLAGTLKTVNHLSEIAAAGEEAQQETRDNLGLTVTATMEPQGDTHDRTADRLAVPGMFGFGKIFSGGERMDFKTESDFLSWVKTATPGRYCVYGGDKIIQGVLFIGIVDIIWPESSPNPNPVYVAKIIIFHGINGHIYYNRYWTAGNGYLSGWENLKLGVSDLIAPLHSTTGNVWGSPDVGGLIFAAYFGASDTDNNRKMIRGQVVPGSRLGAVSITAKGFSSGAHASTPQFITVSTNSFPHAGAFTALSGSHLITLGTSECFVGLFIRVS
ncbi:prophage tail fiber N-terminal domain-containing protein [Citrobacter freundii]|uniref:prophage tail fiber N-terminal domain-containing protein n=1 Tax=Citrobacter freundii TaxID=546 RepID=UPI00383AF460